MISNTVALQTMNRIINKYSSELKGWNPQIFRLESRKTIGICKHEPKIIGVASWFLKECTMEQLVQVTLHEIAHALQMNMYGEGGHGENFKLLCETIGCKYDGPIIKHLDEKPKLVVVLITPKGVTFKRNIEEYFDFGIPTLKVIPKTIYDMYMVGSYSRNDIINFVN